MEKILDHDFKTSLDTSTRNSMGISAFSDQFPTTTSPSMQQDLFDHHNIPYSCTSSEVDAEDRNYYYYYYSTLGFLDTNNIYPSKENKNHNIFDVLKTPLPPCTDDVAESCEASSTPNSSSTNEGAAAASANDDHDSQLTTNETLLDQHLPNTTKKHEAIPKKKKREREERIAFMTKSEVDHLDDGYRWRKYGQKAVKNTHLPRSYYRCTAASCGVKKRVERWCDDPSVVVTTYEGTHKHARPIKHGGSLMIMPQTAASSCFFPSTYHASRSSLDIIPQLHHPLQQGIHSSYFQTHPTTMHSILVPQEQQGRLLANSSPSSSLIQDSGLLQDMLKVKDEPKK